MSNMQASEKALELRDEIKKADAESHAGVWLMGKLLTDLKEEVPSGHWCEFIVNEFGWSRAYPARLMRLYTEYPNGLPEGVGISVLLKTLSLEESIRDGLNNLAAKADLSVEQAERLVADVRADLKTAEHRIKELTAKLENPETREQMAREIRESLQSEVEQEKAELNKTKKRLQDEREEIENRLRTTEQELEQSRELIAAAESTRLELEQARTELDGLKASKRPEKVVTKEVPPADYAETKEKLETALAELEKFSKQEGELDLARAEIITLQDSLKTAREYRDAEESRVAELLASQRARIKYLEGLCRENNIEFELMVTEG